VRRSADGQLPPLELPQGWALQEAVYPWWARPWVAHATGVVFLAIGAVLYASASGTNPFFELSLAELAAVALGHAVAHEACHALGYPGCGLGPHTVFGYHRPAALPFCVYTRPLRLSRALFSALLPLVLVTAIPLWACTQGWLGPGWAALALVNAFHSGSDGVLVGLLVHKGAAWVGYDQGSVKSLTPGPSWQTGAPPSPF
jgi:hypothetical protein